MIDTRRQTSLPAPSAHAWRLDLSEIGGPSFIVMRLDEAEARRALAEHLVEIGKFPGVLEAEQAIRILSSASVSVIW
jgi:hypothetical protein